MKWLVEIAVREALRGGMGILRDVLREDRKEKRDATKAQLKPLAAPPALDGAAEAVVHLGYPRARVYALLQRPEVLAVRGQALDVQVRALLGLLSAGA